MNYFVHESAVVDEGAAIGKGTRIWHFSHVMGGAQIGRHCILGQNVFVGGRAVIGDNVKVMNGVSVYDLVTLEDGVFCGSSMTFTNVKNPRAEIQRNLSDYLPTLVKRGATIGANATIVCGNVIGRYAFIGAGAVVTHSIPDYVVAYGNPAREAGYMCVCGENLTFYDIFAICCKCHREYSQMGQVVSLCWEELRYNG